MPEGLRGIYVGIKGCGMPKPHRFREISPAAFTRGCPNSNGTQSRLSGARDQAQHRDTRLLAAAANPQTRTFLLPSCKKNYPKSARPHLSLVHGES